MPVLVPADFSTRCFEAAVMGRELSQRVNPFADTHSGSMRLHAQDLSSSPLILSSDLPKVAVKRGACLSPFPLFANFAGDVGWEEEVGRVGLP